MATAGAERPSAARAPAARGEPRRPAPGSAPRRLRRAGPLIAAGAALALLYLALPGLAGIDDTWRRLGRGDPWWLGVALGFEVASFAGYLVLLRVVLARFGERLSPGDAYAITLAGVAATRLFAAAGAGGVALTAWALRRRGMSTLDVARAIAAFLVLLYSVFMGALVVFGLGLATEVLPGAAPDVLALGAAAFGAAVIGSALALALVPGELGEGAPSPLARGLGRVPGVVGSGVREALRAVRTRDPRLLGAVVWWAADIAVLWASFRAFGSAPVFGVLVLGYFVGMLGNALPIPGGVGGVDGGMIGAFIACGIDGGLAIVAVLSYRAFAFWLPTVPGVIAYARLRRHPRGRFARGAAGAGRPACP